MILDGRTGQPIYSIPNKPEVTDAIKNYQFAQGQGYGGTFRDHQDAQQKSERAQVIDVPLPDASRSPRRVSRRSSTFANRIFRANSPSASWRA